MKKNKCQYIKKYLTIIIISAFILTIILFFDYVKKNKSINKKFFGNYLAGHYAFKNGQYNKAIKHLIKSTKTTEDIDSLMAILYSNIIKSNFTEAKKYAEYILKKYNTSDNKIKIFLAFNKLADGDQKKASELLKSINQNPENIIINFISIMGYAWSELIKTKNYQKSIEIINKNIGTIFNVNKSTFIIYNKAMIYDFAGQNDLAKKFYEELLKTNVPIRILETCLGFYIRTNNKIMQETIINKIFQKDPLYKKQSEISKKITIQLVSREILLDFGSAMQINNMPLDAIVYTQTAHSITKDDKTLFNTGSIFHINGMYDISNKIYSQIPENSEYYVKSIVNIASNHYNNGEKSTAYDLLINEIKKNNKIIDFKIAIADIYAIDKKYEHATTYYTDVIEEINKNKDNNAYEMWDLYFSRAICLNKQNKWNEAKQDLIKSIEINGDNPNTLNYFAYEMINKNDNINYAIFLLKYALSLDNKDPYITDSLGWAYYKKGDIATALQLVEHAAIALPEDHSINDHLGDIYWTIGRRREAIFQWNKIINFSTNETTIKEAKNKIKHYSKN